MRFKDEFKEEMQKLSPTEEQRERIRNGVMKRLSENSAPIPIKKKKPVYLRIAAISGTAVCAAAIAIFAIVGVHDFNIKSSSGSNAVTEGTNGNYPGNAPNALPESNAGTTVSKPADKDNADGVSKSSEPNDIYSGVSDAAAESISNSSIDDRNGTSDISGLTTSDSYNTNSAGNSGDDKPADAGGITTGGGDDKPPNTDDPSGTSSGSGRPADTGGGTNTDLYIQFSDDKSYFRTIIEGATHYFAPIDGTREFSWDDAEPVSSNYGEALFIQREGDIIAVFSADESLVGVFEMTY